MCVHGRKSPLALAFQAACRALRGISALSLQILSQDLRGGGGGRHIWGGFIVEKALPYDFLFLSHRNRTEVYKG